MQRFFVTLFLLGFGAINVAVASVSIVDIKKALGPSIWLAKNINGNTCEENISQFGLLEEIRPDMGVVIGFREDNGFLCQLIPYRFYGGSTVEEKGLEFIGAHHIPSLKIKCGVGKSACFLISSDTKIFVGAIKGAKERYGGVISHNQGLAAVGGELNAPSPVERIYSNKELARTYDPEANGDIIFYDKPCRFPSVAGVFPYVFEAISRSDNRQLFTGCFAVNNRDQKIIIGSPSGETIEVPYQNVEGALNVPQSPQSSRQGGGFLENTLRFLRGAANEWGKIDTSDPYTQQRMEKCSTAHGKTAWISCVKGYGPVESNSPRSVRCRKVGTDMICDPQ